MSGRLPMFTTIQSPRENGRQICPSPIQLGILSLQLIMRQRMTLLISDNRVGDDYVSHADGDPSQPFAFDGMHAYADRCVWAVLEKKLTDLRASSTSSVRLLDAGCGPGTWLRRLVIRAHALIQQHYRAWIRHSTSANTTSAVGDQKSLPSFLE